MRIMLCDDHPIVMISMTMLFEAHGHEVVATTQRPENLPDLVGQFEPDVCVLDLRFGDRADASEALAAIAAISTSTDVVVVTGAANALEQTAATEAGASAVASKSVPSGTLLALVEGRCDVEALPERRATPTNRYQLTERELQVLQSLVDGDSTARMAGRLHMREATARSHIQSLLLKLGVHNRRAAVAMAIRQGLARLTDDPFNRLSA